MKNLLLIRPKPSWKWYMPLSVTEFLSPPLSLAIVAAHTPPSFKIRIIDEYVENIDFSEKADIVGITIPFTYNAKRAYEISNEFRRRNAKVVLGGMHATLMPEEALNYADAIVIGEAEDTWPQIIDDFLHGKLNREVYVSSKPSIEDTPMPRWDLIKKEKYVLRNVIQVSRGCPYNCDFCTVGKVYGHKPRLKPVDKVINEIKYLIKDTPPQMRSIYFLDDNIGHPASYWKELLRELAPLNVRWLGETSVTTLTDGEFLECLEKSNCTCIMPGFETLSKDNLLDINKRHNLVADYKTIINDLHKHRIAVWAFFIFGLKNDDERTIEATLDFAQISCIDLANFAILTHFPGTKIYDRDKHRLVHEKWWLLDDFIGVDYFPSKISREALWQCRLRAYRTFYSDEYINRRFLCSPETMIKVAPIIYRIKRAVYSYPMNRIPIIKNISHSPM